VEWSGVVCSEYIPIKQYKTFQFYIVFYTIKLKPKMGIYIYHQQKHNKLIHRINFIIISNMPRVSSSTNTNNKTEQSDSKKVAKRSPRQKFARHKLLFNPFEILTKHSIGNAGEDFVCNTIPCETCGHTSWQNLNKIQMNYPGVDLYCSNCSTYVQVKTMCSKNGKCPLSQCSNGAWKFPTSKNTIRETLKTLKGNIRYIAVVYDTNHFVT
jgi:hypothetical protein